MTEAEKLALRGIRHLWRRLTICRREGHFKQFVVTGSRFSEKFGAIVAGDVVCQRCSKSIRRAVGHDPAGASK